jgi:DNA-binding NarL/FixJ family response regulator
VLKEEAAGVACYRLHETMREFAAVKLAGAGETEAAQERLAAHCHLACVTTGADSRYRLPAWLGWADLEIDNFRAVLRWCQARADTRRGLDITVSLAWYWITRATTEGAGWLETFLPGGDERTRSWGYFLRGFLGVLKGDHAAAGPALESAVAAARLTGQHDVRCEALAMASIAASMAGDQQRAKNMLAEAESASALVASHYPAAHLGILQARVLTGLAGTDLGGIDLGAVRASAAEGARLARAAGDLYVLEMMLLNLAVTALIAGDQEQAMPLLTESLHIAGTIDDRVAKFYLLGAIGAVAAGTGQPDLAARLLGAAQTMRANAGASVLPVLASPLAQAEAAALAALGPARYAAAFAAGRDLDQVEAVALALGEQPSRHQEGAAAAAPLGKREADVARLIAAGLTNRQIAARLFISERTVDAHVRAILTKLGFSTRAQVASWVSATD